MQKIEILERRTMMSGTAFAGPVVDPRQFGAVYNGHTDDSAAIQAAINSLPASGGTVSISGVSALAAGIHLIGRTNVRVTAAAPGDGFTLTGVPSQARNPLQFGFFGEGSIVVSRCNGCQVDGLAISANNQHVSPIALGQNAKTNVLNNVIKNTGGVAAIYAVGNTGDSYSGNTIVGSTNYARGLWIGNGYAGASETYPIISNNNISNLAATGIGTISFGATISGNVVMHCAGAGVALSAGGLYSTSNAVVSNNVLDYNGFHGIQADALTDAFTVNNVVLQGNTCDGNANSGIYAWRTLNWTITGNTCDNNVDGITIGATKQITVSGNVLSDTRQGSQRTQTVGVYIIACGSRGVSGVVISGNTISNESVIGIGVVACTGGTISTMNLNGNNITGSGSSGWQIFQDAAGSITGAVVNSIKVT